MSQIKRRTFLAATGAAGVAAGAATGAPPQERPPALKFNLGIVTYNIAASWDIPTILRVCRNVGIAAVELRSTHKHGVEPTLNAQQRKDIRRRFQDAGVTLWGCGTACEFQSPDQAVVKRNIEECRRFCQLVADIGGTGVKVRPNRLVQNVPTERTLAQIGRALNDCGRAAQDLGVEICCEVHGRGTDQPPHMHTIMQHCKHRSVGITWNSNAADVRNGSVSEYFKLLRPWIKSVHIHDLCDDYPYRELFRLLRETGYDRYTLAEIPGMPTVATGERLLRFYKMLWQELNRV